MQERTWIPGKRVPRTDSIHKDAREQSRKIYRFQPSSFEQSCRQGELLQDGEAADERQCAQRSERQSDDDIGLILSAV